MTESLAGKSSGVEALAFLSDPPGGKRPDALILDIAMPGEDGYTVLKKARGGSRAWSRGGSDSGYRADCSRAERGPIARPPRGFPNARHQAGRAR